MRIANEVTHDCCPLCGGEDIIKAGMLNYPERTYFSNMEVLLLKKPALWECRQCHSGFVQNTISRESAKALYASSDAGVRWPAEPFEKSKTAEVIANLGAVFARKGNVLDIGCNTGELLDFAHGYGCDTAGVEYSESSRKTVAGKGHRVYPTLEEAAGRYEVITAFDLVEHLYDVPAFLKTCHDKLTDKGRLVILTGNIESPSARFAGANWWYAQYPEHIVFPSRKYFSDYSGFSIEAIIPTYASKGYQASVRSIILAAVRGLIKGGYSGLPSIGPDHNLIVLSK